MRGIGQVGWRGSLRAAPGVGVIALRIAIEGWRDAHLKARNEMRRWLAGDTLLHDSTGANCSWRPAMWQDGHVAAPRL